MTGSIFFEAVRRNWRTTLYWGIGLLIYGFYGTIIIPDVDMLNQYAQLIESMPPVLMQALGATDAATIATPEGYINLVYFGYVLIILAVYAVQAGLNVTANDEEQGMLDVVLSLPVPRARVLLERLAFYMLSSVVIIIMGLIGLFVGSGLSSLDFDMGKLVVSSINLLPSLLLILTATVFIAVLIRRKGTAVAIVSAFVVTSYFLDFIGRAASGSFAGTLGKISFFHYYDSMTVMQNGLVLANVLLLLGITASLVVGSLWVFQRRDIGL